MDHPVDGVQASRKQRKQTYLPLEMLYLSSWKW